MLGLIVNQRLPMLPVVHNGRLIGTLTLDDVAGHLVDPARDEAMGEFMVGDTSWWPWICNQREATMVQPTGLKRRSVCAGSVQRCGEDKARVVGLKRRPQRPHRGWWSVDPWTHHHTPGSSSALAALALCAYYPPDSAVLVDAWKGRASRWCRRIWVWGCLTVPARCGS
jgi:hypothetical protein